MQNALFRLYFVLICTLLFTIAIPAKSTVAQASAFTYSWSAHGYVDNGSLSVDWVLNQIDWTNPNQPTFTTLEIRQLKCNATKNGVTYMNDHMVLHGGHVECDLPNFFQTVQDLVETPVEICECQLENKYWAAARFEVWSILASPLVALDNSDFLLQVVTDGSGIAHTELSIGNQLMRSAQQPKIGATFMGHDAALVRQMPFPTTRAKFFVTTLFHQTAQTVGISDFMTWLDDGFGNESLQIQAAPLNAASSMNPNPQKLYIGYSPQHGTLFEGEIFDFAIDPPCNVAN